MKGKPAFIKYVVIIFPLIFLWAGLNFDRNNYPNDPEYIYLMNALCICDGQSVGHIDNPGTTLMQIGAGTIGLMHLISGPNNETIVEQVLKNPNEFIEGIRKVIVVLNAIFLLSLGWIVFRKTRSVWPALLLQVSTFLSTYILDVTWAKLSPEPLLFFITGIYVILVFCFYHEQEKGQWKYVILFALITGAGLATKATFLPLFILPLFLLPSVKKKIFYLLGIVPSFVLFTIPAIPEYDRMFFWFRDMISHSGNYGNGEKGIIDTKTYIPNIQSILSFFPAFTIILIMGIITLCVGYYFRKRNNVSEDLKFLAGLLVTFVAGTLLVAKHYGGNHYLIPVLLLTGITLYIILNIIKHIFEYKALNSFLLPVIVIAFIGFMAWNHPSKMIISNKQYKAASEEIDSANSLVEKNYGQYTHVNYYIYSLNNFTGLKFGTDFAKGKMYPHLKKLFPKTYFYELSSDTYLNWNLRTSLDDIVEMNGNKILLMNGPSDSSQIAEMEQREFPLKMVHKGNAQNIYILDTLKYTPPASDKIQQTGPTISFNADQFSTDGKLFIGGSGSEIFGPVNALSTDQARSGTYSIKLEKSNPFAVDYSLKNTKTGELYQIDVWRKSDTSSGYLVVTADDSKTFYQAQNEAIKYDENGWELLRINVDIKNEMEGKNLKIYLWNPRRRTAYFDDLSIKKISRISDQSLSNP
ncbi:MAG: hypothetical protein Q8N05_06615 [Bacteroidota bacterium]|nr:hypothetical protein [Bacteroidota bacterium]